MMQEVSVDLKAAMYKRGCAYVVDLTSLAVPRRVGEACRLVTTDTPTKNVLIVPKVNVRIVPKVQP